MKTKSFLIVSCLFFAAFSFAQIPTWNWAKSLTAPGTGQMYSTYMCTDQKGNTYLTGYSILSLSNSFFVEKYNSKGELLWTKSAITSSSYPENGVAVDQKGNVYVTGSYTSATVTFDSTTTITKLQQSYENGFILKYDSLGNLLWVKNISGIGGVYIHSISLDKNGNIGIAGSFSGNSIDIDSISVGNNSSMIGYDVFIAKCNPEGKALWAKAIGTSSNDEAYNIKFDKKGNSYISGYFRGSPIEFDSVSLTNSSYGKIESFITKYDVNGNVVWAKKVAGTKDDLVVSMCVDTMCNIYVTGYFDSPSISFDTIVLQNTGSYEDLFIAKYDSLGNVVWAKTAGYTDDDVGSGVCVDNKGNLYLTGSFKSYQITFDSIVLKNDNYVNWDIFVVKYNSAGIAEWVKSADVTPQALSTTGIGIDGNDNLYISGQFNSNITFGDTTLYYTPTGQDVFLAKLGSSVVNSDSNIKYSFQIFPNPADQKITINLDSMSMLKCTVTIFNLEGQIIKQRLLLNNKTDIDISNLAKGIYFLEVDNNNAKRIAKFIKQ